MVILIYLILCQASPDYLWCRCRSLRGVFRLWKCLYTPLDDFFNGTLSVTGIVYYLSVIALALFLTEQMIQKRRWTISRNMISTSVFSTGMIAIVVALTVVVNLIASALPETYTQIDATSQKLYSITEDTEKYLDTLKDDVTLYVMVNKNSKDDNVDRT